MHSNRESKFLKKSWRTVFLIILVAAMFIGLVTWLFMNREINKIDKQLDKMENPAGNAK